MDTVVYLIRHGTTDYNTDFKYQGSHDIPLNELGLAQGALLTDYFKDIPIDAGYTSHLIRARQTLDFALGDRKDKIPVHVVPDIAEIDQGITEGRTIQEMDILFPAFSDAINHAPGSANAPRGEKVKHAYERMHKSILSFAQANPGKTIVVASHGFVIQTFLNYASGIPVEDMKDWVLDNVAVSRFTYDDDWNLHIDYIGDSKHLTDDLQVNYDWGIVDRTRHLLLYDSGKGEEEADRLRQAMEKAGRCYAQRDLAKEPLYDEEKEALLLKKNGREALEKGFPLIVTRDEVFTDFEG